ncbi:uncharacterized protein I303_108129 [Kwoniella dejecticola CBS 10117]|uniref:Zn(2)-C6 fungal-type domain-containing protein n=1 Tax=Kwoniella dejecticola CBS 10117 TaxID=1296121 RepID=A0AAJ8MKH9_9TREE
MSSSDARGPTLSPPASGGPSQKRTSGGHGEGGRPQKKRKQRQQFSCAECRRLKLKCDRQIPCANCVRRACGHLCPEKERPQGNVGPNGLLNRLETLEGMLQEHGIPLPSSAAPVNRAATPSNPAPDSLRQRSSSLFKHNDQPSLDIHTSHNNNQPKASTSISPSVPVEGALSDLADAAALSHHEDASTQGMDSGPSIPQPELQQVRFDFSTPSVEALNIYKPVEPPRPDDSPDNQSYGTLVLSHGGRSKYLGPTAASEWLKDQEIHEPVESPSASRYPSPDRPTDLASGSTSMPQPSIPFPFRSQYLRTDQLLSKLPPIDEGMVLVDSYYRYFAWHFNVAPRTSFQPKFSRAYEAAMGNQPQAVVVQELALIYIILAMGALHSLELRANDPLAEHYCNLAKACLAKGDFLVNTTLAGVQSLHIMAHFMLETEKGRNGDSAWPLWGMAMRLSQAMGLHRDGARWNLPAEVVEERRRVFWESYSSDIFQANCFSRPYSISLDYVDTALPANTLPGPDPDFFLLKFELAQISAAILDRAMRVRETPYITVTDLHARICHFEKQIPFRLRCRAALLALPSVYSNPEMAIRDSPAPAPSNLNLSFQQATLAINISETILFLHRPFYARAIYESEDPTRSAFGMSFLAVVERCHEMINVIAGLYALHPNVCARHWYLWYHAFNSAVCLGTLIFRNPKNPLAGFALSQIDSAIGLYTSLVQIGSSRRILNNLRWLLRLRAQAVRKIEPTTGDGIMPTHHENVEDSDDENIELIGLKTRLIERASRGAQTAKTIFQTTPTASGATTSPTTNVNDTIAIALQELLYNSGTPEQNLPVISHASTDDTAVNQNSTNELLHQFWDPMMLQDVSEKDGLAFADSNWWNWDPSIGGDGNNVAP